jgi:hypothetical protein
MFLDDELTLCESCNDECIDLMCLYAESVEAFHAIDLNQAILEHRSLISEDSYIYNEAFEEAKDAIARKGQDIATKFYELIEKIENKWLHLQQSINAKLLNGNKTKRIINAMEHKMRTMHKNYFATSAKLNYLDPGWFNRVLNKIPEVNKVYGKDQENPDEAFSKIMKKLKLEVEQAKEKAHNLKTFKNMKEVKYMGLNVVDNDNEQTFYYAELKHLQDAELFLKRRSEACRNLTNLKRVINSYKGRVEKVLVIQCQKVTAKILKLVNLTTKQAIRVFKDARKICGAGKPEKPDKKLVDRETAEKKNNEAKVDKNKGVKGS